MGSCRLASRSPAVGLQGCLRGPGVPPPLAEPRPFLGSLGLSRRPAWGPPPEQLAEPGAKRVRSELLPLPRPAGCQQVCPQDPAARASPGHLPLSPARPSLRPASPQDLRRPRGALSFSSQARVQLHLRGPALPDSATSNRPSESRDGESAPPKRRQGEVKARKQGGRPPPHLRSLSSTQVLLISPAPLVAVIYLGVCARIVLGLPVGARKTAATNKRGDYKPSSPTPRNCVISWL